ncbi:E3 ubiquitin protein ligase RIE1, partial [Mucuna pruriens]
MGGAEKRGNIIEFGIGLGSLGRIWPWKDCSLQLLSALLTVVFLAFDIFFIIFCIGMACIVFFALFCIIPIIALAYAMRLREGASEEDIKSLPKYRFSQSNSLEMVDHNKKQFDNTRVDSCNGSHMSELSLHPDDSYYPDSSRNAVSVYVHMLTEQNCIAFPVATIFIADASADGFGQKQPALSANLISLEVIHWFDLSLRHILDNGEVQHDTGAKTFDNLLTSVGGHLPFFLRWRFRRSLFLLNLIFFASFILSFCSSLSFSFDSNGSFSTPTPLSFSLSGGGSGGDPPSSGELESAAAAAETITAPFFLSGVEIRTPFKGFESRPTCTLETVTVGEN